MFKDKPWISKFSINQTVLLFWKNRSVFLKLWGLEVIELVQCSPFGNNSTAFLLRDKEMNYFSLSSPLQSMGLYFLFITLLREILPANKGYRPCLCPAVSADPLPTQHPSPDTPGKAEAAGCKLAIIVD